MSQCFKCEMTPNWQGSLGLYPKGNESSTTLSEDLLLVIHRRRDRLTHNRIRIFINNWRIDRIDMSNSGYMCVRLTNRSQKT